jgi:hypothetical protein
MFAHANTYGVNVTAKEITMNTIETLKIRLFSNNQINWNDLFPQPKNGLFPNLQCILQVILVISDALYLNDEKLLSEKVLRSGLYYLVGKSRSLWEAPGGSSYGPWADYGRQYGLSPCCCPFQETISYCAATLGYGMLQHEAVNLQCPAAPDGYRPNAAPDGQSLESRLNSHRQAWIEECLIALNNGEYDFFKDNRLK